MWGKQESKRAGKVLIGWEEHWEQGWTDKGEAGQVWRESRLGRSTGMFEVNNPEKKNTKKHKTQIKGDRTAGRPTVLLLQNVSVDNPAIQTFPFCFSQYPVGSQYLQK